MTQGFSFLRFRRRTMMKQVSISWERCSCAGAMTRRAGTQAAEPPAEDTRLRRRSRRRRPTRPLPAGEIALGIGQHSEGRQGRRQAARRRAPIRCGSRPDGVARRQGPDDVARALGRVRPGRQGRGPRSRDDHPAVGNRQGAEGHAAGAQRLEGRNAEGRRLRARVDQSRRQPLPDALARS